MATVSTISMNKFTSIPRALNLKNTTFQDNEKINLLVHGQTVFLFDFLKYDQEPCTFQILNSSENDGLEVSFNSGSVTVKQISTQNEYKDDKNNKGLITLNGAYYWFSLDSQNQRFCAGIGEARINTAIYQYYFEYDKEQIEKMEENKSFLESLTQIKLLNSNILPRRLLRDPINQYISLYVKDKDELTMDDIADNIYLPSSHLSPTSQILYDSISGKNFVLDDDNFPDFSEAIKYSIQTPGMWCHQKLIEKSTEFNKLKPNIKETYLRITLGENNGESPGIPYVMEIWPVGHYSPVHSHAECDAIIRVLHGTINVSLYPFLNGDNPTMDPFGDDDFYEDDVTWISPTLNQIHQLKNLDTNNDPCITIQCYMYGSENSRHYDYFDYIDSLGKIQQYEPDTDMDFVEFKELMRKEWNNRKIMLNNKNNNELSDKKNPSLLVSAFNKLTDILMPDDFIN